jgi:DnaD/phage-associated family protein
MAYTNTDYSFWTNPKVRAAGKDAAFLYIAGNGFCNEYLTDGFISDTDIETVAFNAFQRQPKKAVESLVRAGLWDRVPGGYKIHDYLDYNKSKQEIEELRSKKSYAGKKGGQASAQARAEADDTAIAETSAQAKTKQYNYVSISNLKDTTTTAAAEEKFAEIAKAYEDVIGSLTGFTAEQLKSAINEYEPSWIIDALKEAATANVRKWAYVEAILKRWKTDGRNSKRANTKQQTAPVDKFRKAYQQVKQ